MEAIKIEVTGNIAKVIEKPLRITSGTVGLPVEFVFDSHWDNMTKVAVFNTGIVKKNMKIVDNATVVPIEALAVPELNLSIGVYGVSEDGAVATPTVWASVGQIRHGAVPGISFGSDIGTAKKYYDLGEQAAEKADASAKKAEAEASVAENAADRANASAKSAEASAALAGEEAEYAIIECTQQKNEAINARHYAEEAAERAEDAADRAESAGGGAGNAVLYTPQSPTPAKQVQAKENIGASTFYHTKREELGVAHEDINTEYIRSLYRALMQEYPDNVQEKEYKSTDGTFSNYAYVISTGEYPTGIYGTVHIKDEHIKKPKYLILSAIDGDERKTALSTYRFIRDVLRGHNVPKYFKEDAIISVMPVGVPYAFDRFELYNENGVYIDRNFDAEWTPTTATGVNPGTSAASEKETQAISKWISDNSDADLYLDVHNNGAVHELVTVIGAPNNATTDAAKKIAMRGVGKITPYWRDVIGYSSFISSDGEYKDVDGDGDKEFVLKEMDVIFVNSASIATNGLSITYAQKVHGIPSLLLELATYYGDYPEWEKNEKAYPAETIAMGAEAIGNIMLEFYTNQLAPIPEVGTPIYNGEALFNINTRTHAKYTGEVE